MQSTVLTKRLSVGAMIVTLANGCATAPTPSAPTHAQVSSDSASDSELDKEMRKRGYQPMLYRGARVYCRYEAVTGSNLQTNVCLTSQQIEDIERASKDLLNGNRAAGCAPKTGASGCN
jgi:hypothetical protein